MEIQKCEVRKGADSLYKYWLKTDDGIEHLIESKEIMDVEELMQKVTNDRRQGEK